ncbi:hypothetical protein BCR42DRAFT_427563 [Absidia repens]|uniref:MYND-type domain-containing protein n=1 Tax=Absidia repens TaxID=90262 RepID=A0A1X2HZL3_9FUNG|nr:hypothetical protein BCR42DRAFT_427563 [Absidia repens]
MPSTLLFPNIIQTENKNNNTIVVTDHCQFPSNSTPYQEDQTWITFLATAIGFGTQRKHGEKGCHQCDAMALHYRQVLVESQKHELNGLVLELIWQMTKMLLEHMETRMYHSLGWFDAMAQDLFRYAKQLKEGQTEGELENAIRITIYHCRAALHQHDGGRDDLIKARVYYRKCVSLPTEYETQQSLQHTASVFLSQHPLALYTSSSIFSSSSVSGSSSPNSSSSFFSLPPPLQPSSSISSTPSSISLSSLSSSTPLMTPCGHCGLEKKAMPVCAKCKYQRYCSAKCLKKHQPTHALVCQNQ